jgi:hypothetical protein
MPEYRFSITHNGEPENPPHSIDFTNDKGAWEEATIAAGQMLRDLDGNLKPGADWAIEVRRAAGDLVFRVRITAEGFGGK